MKTGEAVPCRGEAKARRGRQLVESPSENANNPLILAHAGRFRDAGPARPGAGRIPVSTFRHRTGDASMDVWIWRQPDRAAASYEGRHFGDMRFGKGRYQERNEGTGLSVVRKWNSELDSATARINVRHFLAIASNAAFRSSLNRTQEGTCSRGPPTGNSFKSRRRMWGMSLLNFCLLRPLVSLAASSAPSRHAFGFDSLSTSF